MQEPVEITYGMVASGNKRFLNCIIDSIVVTFIQIALSEVFNLLYKTYGHEGFLIGPPEIGNFKYTMFGLGINIVYYGLFESLSMRTAGKYVTNTKVVNRDGTTPDNGAIFIRTLCRLIPFEFLSFILKKPVIGWHDSFSKTLVVDIAAFKHAKRMKELKDIADNEEKENYD
jgi:uncharacterized RDD family membrane protein YckC